MQEIKKEWEAPKLEELSFVWTEGGVLSSPVENSTGHS